MGAVWGETRVRPEAPHGLSGEGGEASGAVPGIRTWRARATLCGYWLGSCIVFVVAAVAVVVFVEAWLRMVPGPSSHLQMPCPGRVIKGKEEVDTHARGVLHQMFSQTLEGLSSLFQGLQGTL